MPVETVNRKVTKKASMCTAHGASWRSKNEYVVMSSTRCTNTLTGKGFSLREDHHHQRHHARAKTTASQALLR